MNCANKEGIDMKIINRITGYLAVFLVFVVTLACGLLAPDGTGGQYTTKFRHTFASCRLASGEIESMGIPRNCQPAVFPRWDEPDKLSRLRPVLCLLGRNSPGRLGGERTHYLSRYVPSGIPRA